MLTPIKGYKKMFSRFGKSALAILPTAPNMELSDVLPVDAETRLQFRSSVKHYLDTRDERTSDEIYALLQYWRRSASAYPAAFKGNVRLMNVASHAVDLSTLSRIGLDAMEALKTGKPMADADARAAQAEIDKARKNVAGDVELAIIPEIESLVKQKLVPEPKQFSPF